MVLRKNYTNEVVYEGNINEIYDYVCELASRDNYGLFRVWEDENGIFFDCGPVYFVEKDSAKVEDFLALMGNK